MRYTWYENYPDNRLIVGGVDLSVTYRMILSDGYTLGVPEAKTYTVDIPGGDGVIDLTESLIGDTVYNNRTQEFTFYIIDQQNQTDFENVKTDVSNYLNGKAFDYILTWDPEYIYHGRFHVSSYEHEGFPTGILGAIKITVDADPYKSKGTQIYTLNPFGGREYTFNSGRKKVHPILECGEPCKVHFEDESEIIPAGTSKLNFVTFQEGTNTIYFNSHQLYATTWDDIGENGNLPLIWGTVDEAEDEEEGTIISTSYKFDDDGTYPGTGWTTYSNSASQSDIDEDWDESGKLYRWRRVRTSYSDETRVYSYYCEYANYDDNAVNEEDTDMPYDTYLYYQSTDSKTTYPPDYDDDGWLVADLVGAWLDASTQQYNYVYLYADSELDDYNYVVYLWMRYETLYSDNTRTLYYTVAQESTYGDDYTEEITYQASLDGSTVPDGTWSSEYPETEDYPYIWVRYERTYTFTGNVTYSYDVNYTLYENEDFISVESTDREYYLVQFTESIYDWIKSIYFAEEDPEYLEWTDIDSASSVYDIIMASDYALFDFLLMSAITSVSDTLFEELYNDGESILTTISETYPVIDSTKNYILFTVITTNYSNGTSVQNVDIDYEFADAVLVSISARSFYVSDSTNSLLFSYDGYNSIQNSTTITEDSDSADLESIAHNNNTEIVFTQYLMIFENDDGEQFAVTRYTTTYYPIDGTIYDNEVTIVTQDIRYQYSTSSEYLSNMLTDRFSWTKTKRVYDDGGIACDYECIYNGEQTAGAGYYRWDELHLLFNGVSSYTRAWNDISGYTWEQVSSANADYPVTWDGLGHTVGDSSESAYITLYYDWEDL